MLEKHSKQHLFITLFQKLYSLHLKKGSVFQYSCQILINRSLLILLCKRERLIDVCNIFFSSAGMAQNSNRKYSKISSALKYYFFNNLYYHCLDIREAADKCKINYSTAKLILRDLTPEQKKCIKRLVRQKQKDEKEGMDVQETCAYKIVQNVSNEHQKQKGKGVQIIATVGYDFFAPLDKK